MRRASALLLILLTGCAHPVVPVARQAAAGVTRAASADPALLPRFTRTKRGEAGDPINVVIAATESQLLSGFDQRGWEPADPTTLRSVLRMVRTAVGRSEYPTAPISPLYLFDRRQDHAFQKNTRGITARDHLRAWRTPLRDELGRPYWAIAATADIAVAWHRDHPTHKIDPDIDAERELVVQDWLATGMVAKRSEYRALPEGYRGRNGEADPYFTDGRVIVLELVEQP